MQATPLNIEWPPTVAYIKIPMQEVLVDRNFMQEMKV